MGLGQTMAMKPAQAMPVMQVPSGMVNAVKSVKKQRGRPKGSGKK